jgi:hypothetical protein
LLQNNLTTIKILSKNLFYKIKNAVLWCKHGIFIFSILETISSKLKLHKPHHFRLIDPQKVHAIAQIGGWNVCLSGFQCRIDQFDDLT